MQLALIWAMARNRTIGRDNTLPWLLPDEMRAFRRITMGKPIIAGRRTFASFGKPLPGRTNIVVSRQPHYAPPGALVAASLDAALTLAAARCSADGVDEALVVGGRELYAAALPLAERLYMTIVHADIDGDVAFPEFALGEFVETARSEHAADERHAHAFTMYTLERRRT